MAAQAATQKTVYDDVPGLAAAPREASVNARACPGCGAGRAQQDGLTRCGYCGYQFIDQRLTDGIHLSSSDNSD
jgi:hypothetical protein